MELLNQQVTRMLEAARGLSPAARVFAVAALVGLVAAGVWGFGDRLVPPGDAYLMNGQSFSAAQLRQMEAALGKAGLTQYEIAEMRMRVPQSQQARYMAALAEAQALPTNFGDHLKAAVEQNSFLLSGSRQEAQLKVAMQQELQAIINQFQGIDSSSVQIAEAISTGFPSTKTVTASVSIRPAQAAPLDERTASAIRCIVAQSWGGLRPENVTVVDILHARMFSGSLDHDHSAAAYAETKKQLETDWQEKIARLLGIPGLVVTTNVELTADGHGARSVSAAVGVPSEHFLALRRGGQPSARPDMAALVELERAEHERIKQAILPLLLFPGGDGPASNQVSVSTLHAAPLHPAELNYERLAADWLVANWQNVVLGILVVIAILLMYSMFRGARPAGTAATSAAEIAQSLSLVTPDEPLDALPPQRRPAESAAHARSGELAQQIRRDPQAAASVLKNWIGNAS